MVDPKEVQVELFQALTVDEIENRAMHGYSNGLFDSISDATQYKSHRY